METLSSTSSSSKRFFLTLAVFCLGLVAIDQVVAKVVDRAATFDYKQAIASKKTYEPSTKHDVWVIGDSLAADGFVPSVFTEITGLSAFNWGIYASSPFEWEILYTDLVERNGHPKFLVIACSPHMFVKRPSDGPFAAEAIRPQFHGGLFRGSVLRDDLSALFESGRKRLVLKGALGRLAKSRTALLSTKSDNGYYVAQKPLDRAPRPMIESVSFERENATLQHTSLAWLLKRSWGGADPRTQVFFVRMPVHPIQLAIYKKEKETWDDYNTVLGQLAARHGARVFDGQTDAYVSQYENADFTDAIHLSESGARKLTADLARFLR